MTHQEAGKSLAAERYLLNEMSDEQRLDFEEHFFSCEDCAEELRSAAAMLEGAKEGFANSAVSNVVPMPLANLGTAKRAWHRSLMIPWAAAATLAGVVTYQSIRVVPSVGQGTSPVAFVPVALHPESRGAEPVVTIPPGNAPVSLALEINDAPQTGELTYELKSLDGRPVVSGHAPVPQPGTPLFLLMPAWTLTGSMHYILSVHDAAPSGRSLGEYRFAVSTH